MQQRTREQTVLVLQGGGALGAYQAGAYEALAEAGLAPDWVVGISIGAINAGIIAGNPPEHRVAQLRAFWELVSSGLQGQLISDEDTTRAAFNIASAALGATYGIPGFFTPRFPHPMLRPPGGIECLSIYDTSPLRETLLRFVDFDVLNGGQTRLSVGAVNVATGNFAYFDTAGRRLGPEHIMASGALPPGFPPVEIEGELYWDGGLVSNTPLEYALDREGRSLDMLIFQVDLFSARGPLPRTLLEVAQREKDIRYSSRTRFNTDILGELHVLRSLVRRMAEQAPDDPKHAMDKRLLDRLGRDTAITIVHLIYREQRTDRQSKDYEFSRLSVEEHWAAGRADVRRTIEHAGWLKRGRPAPGFLVLDLTKDEEQPPSAKPCASFAAQMAVAVDLPQHGAPT